MLVDKLGMDGMAVGSRLTRGARMRSLASDTTQHNTHAFPLAVLICVAVDPMPDRT